MVKNTKETLKQYDKAILFYERQDYKRAIENFLDFLKNADTQDPTFGFAHRYLAECYLSLMPPLFEKAESSAQIYHHHFLGHGELEEVQRALVTIATVFLEQAMHPDTNPFLRESYADRCRHFFRESLKCLPSEDKPSTRARMKVRNCRNLLVLEAFFDNKTEMMAILSECQREASACRPSGDLCDSYLIMAKFLIDNEDYVAADTHLRLAIEELRQLGSERRHDGYDLQATSFRIRLWIAQKKFDDVFRMLKNIRKQGKNDDMKKWSKRCTKWVKKLQEIGAKLELNPNVASLWESQGDLYDKFGIKLKGLSLHSYKEALKLKPENETNLLFTIGQVNEEMKNWKEAKIFYLQEIAHPQSTDKESSALGALRCSCLLEETKEDFIRLLQFLGLCCHKQQGL